MKLNKLKATLASALLIGSATVMAEPQVEFWGWTQKFIDTDRVSGCTGDTCSPGVRLSSFISKVGLKVTEPLNDVQDGLKFVFHLDTAYFSDAPDEHRNESGPRSRDISIGDERAIAKFENKKEGYSVAFGHDAHILWKNLRSIAPMGDLYSTFLGEIHERQKLRYSNAVFGEFDLGGGVSIQADYSLAEKEGVDDKYGLGVNYTPTKDWRFTAATVNARAPSTGYTTDDKSNLYTASYYGFKDWKLTYMHSDDQYKDVERNGNSYHVFKQINPKWSAGAAYGHRNESNVKAYQLGLNYHMTKNLQVQFRASRTTADDVIRFTTPDDLGGINGTDRTNIGVGLRFTF